METRTLPGPAWVRVPLPPSLARRVALLAILGGLAVAFGPAAASGAPGATVIDDVRVIDVVEGELLPGRQRVVVRDGWIDAIGPVEEVEIPGGAEVIEGRGRYLAPGLVDMHVHLYGPFEEDLIPYLANGVTSIREMGGWRQTRLLRDAREAGEVMGPRIFLSSWFNDGDPPLSAENFVVTTRRQAKRMTRDYADLGYDFIKIYTNLSREITDVFLKEGRRHGLPVVGHVPTDYPLRELLATDFRTMEHLLGFAAAIERQDSPSLGRWDYRRVIGSIPIREEEVPVLALEIAGSGIWSTPTLVTSSHVERREQMLARLLRPEYRWVPEPLMDLWRDAEIPFLDAYLESFDIADEEFAIGRQRKSEMVGALHEAGAGLLIGTDAPVNTVIPGLGFHQETRNLAAAGLSAAEVLRAATWSAAQALGAADEIGTVEVGRRADLILVRKNPLRKIRTLAKPQGVMIDGLWLGRQEVRRMWRDAVDHYPDVDFTNAGPVAGHLHGR